MTTPPRSDKRILVTGASSGIGQALAIRIARDGFPVAVHYATNRAGAQATLATIQEQGGSASLLDFDVADRDAARMALTADIARSGPFWGIVLNAGITRDFAFPALEPADWDLVLTTNLDGFYNVVHPLIMPMIRRRAGGRIIAISSVSGLTGNRGQVNYSAAKAGLIGATKALAVELATRGITANVVVPGIIETAMTANLPTDALKMIPMQRIGKPEDVAGIVAFLLGAEAGYITRQTISVNGGMV
jgi:3-oxoacyl-[acyl-carrier protein] reductase